MSRDGRRRSPRPAPRFSRHPVPARSTESIDTGAVTLTAARLRDCTAALCAHSRCPNAGSEVVRAHLARPIRTVSPAWYGPFLIYTVVAHRCRHHHQIRPLRKVVGSDYQESGNPGGAEGRPTATSPMTTTSDGAALAQGG